ncbi:pentapeptide repeat-containing protein [Dictyobacter aurantiacus]|uniref:Pentapeptide repeat-containing protein n=1 Tax=Dictyobacter aurantiacus TaxID=1936993 RepID=A0A401ZJM2_9CHLR|nr:pentapeptide repeat-containing protein [Dictyobacter aurantiacus]GCE07065.1 hypothetical protein KDAU_43940 [Dictyobacter aurantiacus]
MAISRTADEWRAHWQTRGQEWRTEAEIDAQRQVELNACLERETDIERGLYPFKDVSLNRADVEWLLAQQEQRNQSGGPYGIDLRAADLRRADLHALPLTGMRGALRWDEWTQATAQQRDWARANLEGADLSQAQLEGAVLNRVNIQHARLRGACLDEADLSEAHAQGAYFDKASLRQADLRKIQAIGSSWQDAQAERADFSEASLQGAEMTRANLRNSNLRKASLQQVELSHATLTGAYLHDAEMQEVTLQRARLDEADLSLIYAMGANLRQASLKGAYMRGAHLEGSDLTRASLKGADLSRAHLAGATMNAATLDRQTQLTDIELTGSGYQRASLVDISWGDVVLSRIDWSTMTRDKNAHGTRGSMREASEATSLRQHSANSQEALRSYRQLTLVLKQQGLDEDSARFAYAAHQLQRELYWRHHTYGAWFCSLLLDLLAGYGYRPWRLLAAYALIILSSTLAYFVIGSFSAPHLTLLDAALISVTAFHGRVFWEDATHPSRLRLWIMAAEALAGLVIESVLIAVLVRRLMNR